MGNMDDPCPECDSTEFDHVRYAGRSLRAAPRRGN